MTKKLAWIFAVIPLAVVAVVYFTASPSEPDLPKGIASVGKPDQTRDGGFRNASAKPVAPTNSTPQAKTREEVQREIKALQAELAIIFTPLKQKELVDSIMKDREPKIRALFDSWDLDTATGEKVLQAIRQREELHVAAQFTPSDEYEATQGTTQAQFFKHNKQWTEVELGVLLGEERVEQLARLEAQLLAESAAKGVALGKALAKERK
jgi:predicted transcriptional regulator